MSELLALVMGHALADFGLQNQFVADYKSPLKDSTPFGATIWPYVLIAHGLMHGAVVFLITCNPWLGLAETVAHSLIDYCKCTKRIGWHADQWLHLGCKVWWWLW
mgnify:CR=1 FL=1